MQVYGAILPGAATLARLLRKQAAEARQEVTLSLDRRQAEAALSLAGKHRLKVIRWYENHGRNVTRTANHFGFSRPTIHAWLQRYRRAGPKGPEERRPPPPSVRTPPPPSAPHP